MYDGDPVEDFEWHDKGFTREIQNNFLSGKFKQNELRKRSKIHAILAPKEFVKSSKMSSTPDSFLNKKLFVYKIIFLFIHTALNKVH